VVPTALVHIAIVDDDPDVRLLARTLIDIELADVQHHVTEVADGPAAIDLCDREWVDVLVLDLHMPEMNGQEVIRNLCVAEGAPYIVAWSADAEALRAAVKHGAHATVTKGTDGADLLRAVRDCLCLS
jgi:CheY-like chemotaxis protein